MAGRQGLEPRYADPESAVLPLDDLPARPNSIIYGPLRRQNGRRVHWDKLFAEAISCTLSVHHFPLVSLRPPPRPLQAGWAAEHHIYMREATRSGRMSQTALFNRAGFLCLPVNWRR